MRTLKTEELSLVAGGEGGGEPKPRGNNGWGNGLDFKNPGSDDGGTEPTKNSGSDEDGGPGDKFQGR